MAHDTHFSQRKKLQKDLTELQLYYVFSQIRLGRTPGLYQTDGKRQQRSRFEFTIAAWTPFYRHFKDPSCPSHKEPAWIDFCHNLETLFQSNNCLTVGELSQKALDYVFDMRQKRATPPPSGPSFGCFRYNMSKNGSYTALHFHNAYMPRSPFKHKDKLFQSLQNLVKHILSKEIKPDSIGMDSWMDNLPCFQELFPDEFRESLTPTSPDAKTGFGWWGQFVSRKGTLHDKRANQLKKTGEFPFKRAHAECDFNAFCKHINT